MQAAGQQVELCRLSLSLRDIGNGDQKHNNIKGNAEEQETGVGNDPPTISNERERTCCTVYTPLITKQLLAAPLAKRNEPDDDSPGLSDYEPQNASDYFFHTA